MTNNQTTPTDIYDRQPPADIDAEKALIGSVMLSSDCFDDVASLVSADSFYDQAHQILWRTMGALIEEKGHRYDPVLLTDRLKACGNFELIGGMPYLFELGRSVPTAAHAVHYANIVRDKAMLRGLLSAATDTIAEVYDDGGGTKATEIVSRAETRVLAVQDRRGASEVKSIGDLMIEAMDRLDGEQQSSGLPTGYVDLDKVIQLAPGELIILGARPGMGKTALATNIAEYLSIERGNGVAIVSLEMSAAELCNRVLASQARVDSHKMKRCWLSPDERQMVIQASADVANAPLAIIDESTLTMAQIAAFARRVRRSGNLDLLVIDYLQLIEPDNPKDPRQEQVSKISRRLKQLARELEVPVLCLSQLNRANETGQVRSPTLSNLRESGAIEQDADMVLFVHRPGSYATTEDERQKDNSAELHVAKQRNGPCGEVELCWFPKFVRFDSKAQREMF